MKLSRRSKVYLTAIVFCIFGLHSSQREVIQSFLSKTGAHRLISLAYGNGECKWTPPSYEAPEGEFYKTLVAGFPSGDKRLMYIQIEALTGLTARDEWAFAYNGYSNEPFIKSNYPHHEGVWSWGQGANQVLLVVRNMRETVVEYHEVLWDLRFPTNYADALKNSENLFRNSIPLDAFYAWRDGCVLGELKWYGWFIDYWMEGGLMRDISSNKLTTPEHWNMLQKKLKDEEEMTYDLIVGEGIVVPAAYDPHCINDLPHKCRPVDIISADRLVETGTTRGKQETRKIAKALEGKIGVGDVLLDEDAWDCIWSEIIENKKGSRTFRDRIGYGEVVYNFSEEMLTLMIEEQNRLINKYNSAEWVSMHIAHTLVDILVEHRGELVKELLEVQAGERRLEKHDFLGPNTRKKLDIESQVNVGSYW